MNKDLLILLILSYHLKVVYSTSDDYDDDITNQSNLANQLNNKTFLFEKILNNSTINECIFKIKFIDFVNSNNNRHNLHEYYFRKSEFLLFIQNCSSKSLILNEINQCEHITLIFINSYKNINDLQSTSSSSSRSFLSSKTQLLIYLMLFMIIFAFLCIFVYVIKTSTKFRERKKYKKSNQSNYFNPFEIIKIGMQTNTNNATNNNQSENYNLDVKITNESSAELLQPSSNHDHDLSSGDFVKVDQLINEGDTRSEYSITDIERMKYVQQWVENLSY